MPDKPTPAEPPPSAPPDWPAYPAHPAGPALADRPVPPSAPLLPGDAAEPAPDWPALWNEILSSRLRPGSGRVGEPGRWSEASSALLALYAPLLAARERAQPWRVAQLGQSLDGCIATRSGDSYFVTGAQSLLHLHRLRALCDVVLVGAGTVAADDPQLTTRRVSGPSPTRAVIDPAARLDLGARVFRDGQVPTLWLCDAVHGAAARARLEAAGLAGGGTEVVAIDGLLARDGACERHYDPARVVATLLGRGLAGLFVEGGGATVSRFIAADCLDRLHLTIAPVLIGSGRPGLALPPRAAMRDCPRFTAQVIALGEDRLWDLDLRTARTQEDG